PLYLGAQAHLQPFYARFGFIPVTDVYDEDGIPHRGMAREVHHMDFYDRNVISPL
ncbi:GNAT family N-acetyltransferase, partial [Salmonella enterica subsp. enterica serovar Montevideo]|nr:GNAT family N-acetyltransferase [Salmonella enterica subsp. enterica serovar Montevideo]